MAHLHRFYHPESTLAPTVDLHPEEAHHALRVLRIRPGDGVELFDGQGRAWSAEVVSTTRSEVTVALREETFTPRPEPEITLAQAWLHRESILDDLIREATVLGVGRFCFFRAAHSEKTPRLSAKWRRILVEACKQCGRRWLPEVTVEPTLSAALARLPEAQWVVAAMAGPHTPWSALPGDRPLVFAVGPEGDFAPAELETLRGVGALPVGLGHYTLRSEAAALAGLTLMQHHLGHLGPR